jgi:hypothetical protein
MTSYHGARVSFTLSRCAINCFIYTIDFRAECLFDARAPTRQLMQAAKDGRASEAADLLGEGAMLEMNDEVRLRRRPMQML